MPVHVASDLQKRLDLLPDQGASLVQAFQTWKSNSGREHYFFCREKRGDDGYLYHAHLIPANITADREDWDRLWLDKPYKQRQRRSDRYILYADGGRNGYLLIEILDDPGAHDLWIPAFKNVLSSLIAIADNFVNLRIIP